MTIPLLIQIRRLPSLTISLPGSVSTNLWQFGLTTAWELRNFATLSFLGRQPESAHGQPRARVPDLVGSRLPRPYHFRARIQSFQAVAAPFPRRRGNGAASAGDEAPPRRDSFPV